MVAERFHVPLLRAQERLRLTHVVERLLTVFHNRRWDNDFLTLQDLVARGAVGRIRRLESRWERYRPEPKGGWREQPIEGTGVLYDLGSHLIDQVLQLFGPPGRILSHLQIQREVILALEPCLESQKTGRWMDWPSRGGTA